ncbi:MAG: MFS transporter, partial [Erysipelotrichaceae bacterium]|nr:MFS transporter [Erysipelotrichaceae bacterium]
MENNGARRNIPIMFLICFLQGMVFYAFVATIYRTTYGITLFEISLIEGINYALTIALEIPWGILADRIGYKKTMIICEFLYFISKIMFYKANGFFLFLLERIVLAFAFAGLSGVDSSIIYLSDPENDHRNFGFYSSCGTAGMLLASFVFAVYIKDDLRLSAWLTIFPYGLSFLLTLLLKEVRNTEEKKTERNVFSLLKEVFRNRKMLRLLIATALMSETTHLLAVFLNQEKFLEVGLTLSQISYVGILTSLLDMSSAVSKKASDLLGRNRLAIFILLLEILSALLIAFSHNVLTVIVSFCMIDILFGFFMPISSSIQHENISSSDRASMISGNSMLIDMICVFVITVCGKIADYDLKLGVLSCA